MGFITKATYATILFGAALGARVGKSKCPSKHPKCPSLPSDVCYHGHQRSVPPADKNYPRCWYYFDNAWGCYHAVNGQCEWKGAVDLESHRCSFNVIATPNFYEGKHPAYNLA